MISWMGAGRFYLAARAASIRISSREAHARLHTRLNHTQSHQLSRLFSLALQGQRLARHVFPGLGGAGETRERGR